MSRGILIAGNESSLSAAVAAEAAKRVERFAVSFIPNRIAGPDAAAGGGPPESPKGRIVLDWNPGSPLSARTLVLSAENRLERVDEAILICAPPPVRRLPEDLVPGEIETAVNDHIKGWFFLVRELASLFKAGKRGILSLVLSDIGAAGAGKDETADLLGPAAAAAFRAFVQGLITASLTEPYQVLGFSSSEIGEDAAFAAFIFKILEEGKHTGGRWHKFGRMGFFGRFG